MHIENTELYKSEIKREDLALNELWWAVSYGEYYQRPSLGPRFFTQDISWPVK
jgi:hypothetical protein